METYGRKYVTLKRNTLPSPSRLFGKNNEIKCCSKSCAHSYVWYLNVLTSAIGHPKEISKEARALFLEELNNK